MMRLKVFILASLASLTLHFVGGLLKTIGPYKPEEGGVE